MKEEKIKETEEAQRGQEGQQAQEGQQTTEAPTADHAEGAQPQEEKPSWLDRFIDRTYKPMMAFYILAAMYILFRMLIGERCIVPSESMENTIHPGWQWMDHLTYGCRLPQRPSEIPLVNTLIPIEGPVGEWDRNTNWGYCRLPGWRKPRRLDLIIFNSPENDTLLLVKRVVALPGDTLEIRSGTVYINNKVLPMPSTIIPTTPAAMSKMATYPEGNTTWNMHNYGPIVIPADQDSYFVLGDNRAHSNDSRYWGLVPWRSIKGRMFVLNQ